MYAMRHRAFTNGFRWLPSYYESIRDLPDAERLMMYDAISDFGFGNEVGELPPLLDGYFGLIKPTVAKSIRFEKKQAENGAKGGRPPKPKKNPAKTQTNPKDEPRENLAVDVAIDNDIAFDVESAVDTAVAPTLEDVQAYVREIGSPVDPERFYDHYTAEGWISKSGNPIVDWRAKLRSWAKTEQTRPAKADRYSILDKARQADAENDPRWANVHYDIGPQFEE